MSNSVCHLLDWGGFFVIYRQVKRFIQQNLTTPLAPIPLKLAEGEARPQPLDGGKQQTDNSMKQTSQGDASSFQIKIEGGTAHIAERMDFYPPPHQPS